MKKTVTVNIFKEFIIWLIIFGLSFLLNVISILIYKTSWTELYSQLGFVFMISCALYVFIVAVRLIVFFIRGFVKNHSQKSVVGK